MSLKCFYQKSVQPSFTTSEVASHPKNIWSADFSEVVISFINQDKADVALMTQVVRDLKKRESEVVRVVCNNEFDYTAQRKQGNCQKQFPVRESTGKLDYLSNTGKIFSNCSYTHSPVGFWFLTLHPDVWFTLSNRMLTFLSKKKEIHGVSEFLYSNSPIRF